jgi:hypothetical protein
MNANVWVASKLRLEPAVLLLCVVGFAQTSLASLFFASTPLAAQAITPRIQVRVGPNVAVWPGGAPQAEPFIAAHPSKPGVLIIGTSDQMPNWGLLPHAYVTTNAGRTWTRVSLPGLEEDLGASDLLEGAGDPWLAIDADGHLYFSALRTVRTKGTTVRLYESADDGRHWEICHVLTGGSLDAAKVLPVSSKGGPGLLLIMNAGGKDLLAFGKPSRSATGIAIFRSEDRGKSFAPAALIAPSSHTYGTQHAVRLASGSVLVMFSEFGASSDGSPRAGYYVARSTDGGKTFGAPTLVASVPRQYPDSAWLAAGTSRGRVYAGWEDGDFGARVTFVNGKRVREEAGTHRSVAIARSDDDGQTWLSPVSLEAAGAGPCYLSTAAVSSGGTVGVLWLQHERYETNPRCYRPYFAASTDGGRSFATAVPVADSLSCPTRSMADDDFFTYRPRGGDYIGLAAAVDGSFHAAWSDARDGSFRTYTARIVVDVGKRSPVRAF